MNEIEELKARLINIAKFRLYGGIYSHDILLEDAMFEALQLDLWDLLEMDCVLKDVLAEHAEKDSQGG